MRLAWNLPQRRTMNSTTAMKVFKIVLMILVVIGIWQAWIYLSPSDKTAKIPHDFNEPKVLENTKLAHHQGDELAVGVQPPLRVAVYYEALCPDSRHFLMQQLTQAYRDLSHVMDVQFVPYGKAFTTVHADGTMSFKCQHGPKECAANKVHACVAKHITNASKQMQIINCMIDINFRREAVDAGRQCTLHFDGDWQPIRNCSTSPEGDGILHHMGKMTKDLSPKATFIPTITIDGSQDQQPLILRDLRKAICKLYRGSPAPACANQ